MVKNIEENKLYTCSSCEQHKPKEAFSKNKNNKLRDGLNYVCKECYSKIYNNHRGAWFDCTSIFTSKNIDTIKNNVYYKYKYKQ